MFTVSEIDAAAIRRAFSEEGELSAMIELRRRFPLVTGNTEARNCVRIIAGWHPPPPASPKVTRFPRRPR